MEKLADDNQESNGDMKFWNDYVRQFWKEGHGVVVRGNAQSVLMAYAVHLDSDWQCFPGSTRISKLTKISVRELRRINKKLTGLGYMARSGDGGRMTSSTELLLPPVPTWVKESLKAKPKDTGGENHHPPVVKITTPPVVDSTTAPVVKITTQNNTRKNPIIPPEKSAPSAFCELDLISFVCEHFKSTWEARYSTRWLPTYCKEQVAKLFVRRLSEGLNLDEGGSALVVQCKAESAIDEYIADVSYPTHRLNQLAQVDVFKKYIDVTGNPSDPATATVANIFGINTGASEVSKSTVLNQHGITGKALKELSGDPRITPAMIQDAIRGAGRARDKAAYIIGTLRNKRDKVPGVFQDIKSKKKSQNDWMRDLKAIKAIDDFNSGKTNSLVND